MAFFLSSFFLFFFFAFFFFFLVCQQWNKRAQLRGYLNYQYQLSWNNISVTSKRRKVKILLVRTAAVQWLGHSSMTNFTFPAIILTKMVAKVFFWTRDEIFCHLDILHPYVTDTTPVSHTTSIALSKYRTSWSSRKLFQPQDHIFRTDTEKINRNEVLRELRRAIYEQSTLWIIEGLLLRKVRVNWQGININYL